MPSAPPEIWRLIFRFVARSDESFHAGYRPFEKTQELSDTARVRENERTRRSACRSLVVVSRAFRALATELLYQDVRVGDATALESLMCGLTRSAKEDGEITLGSYILRLELPTCCSAGYVKSTGPLEPSQLLSPSQPAGGSDWIQLANLLSYCTHLQVFVRPSLPLDGASIAFWASLVQRPISQPLKHLQRLEWHETELDPRFYGANNSARLRDIISQAPQLRYLFLSSDRAGALDELALPSSVRTIHLHRSHFHAITPHHPPSFSRAIRAVSRSPTREKVAIPQTLRVRHLVLHSTLPTALLDFVAKVGEHLRVLELAFAPQMTFSSGQLQRILSRTPVLGELAYYLAAPEIAPLGKGIQAASIRRIRLKVNPDDWSPSKPALRSQLEILLGDSFPGLKEVVLHGPAEWFLKREVVRQMLSRLHVRGCTVVGEDGTAL